MFAANRVAEILDTTDVSQWKHVSCINNPADIGTRAINIEDKAEKEIPKGSKILQFSPFLDEEGIIRAKGRISESQLEFNAKHPKLLHWKHHAVELFLRNGHKNNQHEGTEYVRNIVQQEMWILGIRNALRSIKNKCVNCRKAVHKR